MNASTKKKSIPESGFGFCRWCGLENTRLHFLMCPNCFRISNMIPSKAMVLLNRPELKKKWYPTGPTIISFTPELRNFLIDPKSNFPSEKVDKEHWEHMRKEALNNVTQPDIKFFLEEFVSQHDYVLPKTDEELLEIIGLDCILRFMLRVCVERDLLKIGIDLDESEFIDTLCDKCKETRLFNDESDGWQPPKIYDELHSSSPKPGMKVRDIIFKKYGR